jgi:membrane protease subunit HflK
LTIGLSGDDSSEFDPSAGEFMTGDLNLLRMQTAIQYRVADPVKFVLRAEQVEPLLSRLGEAALTRALGFRSVDGVLRSERQAIARDVERELQKATSNCQLGVAILGVNLTDARPPGEVAADFAAAQSAESHRDRRINEARSYAETTGTTARSQAQKSIEAAHAAATRRTLTAKAQAQHFNSLLAEALRARDLTIRRIYIESIQALLDRVKNKVVLPSSDSIDVTVLGTNEEPAAREHLEPRTGR